MGDTRYRRLGTRDRCVRPFPWCLSEAYIDNQFVTPYALTLLVDDYATDEDCKHDRREH